MKYFGTNCKTLCGSMIEMKTICLWQSNFTAMKRKLICFYSRKVKAQESNSNKITHVGFESVILGVHCHGWSVIWASELNILSPALKAEIEFELAIFGLWFQCHGWCEIGTSDLIRIASQWHGWNGIWICILRIANLSSETDYGDINHLCYTLISIKKKRSLFIV